MIHDVSHIFSSWNMKYKDKMLNDFLKLYIGNYCVLSTVYFKELKSVFEGAHILKWKHFRYNNAR